jgi:AAA domain
MTAYAMDTDVNKALAAAKSEMTDALNSKADKCSVISEFAFVHGDDFTAMRSLKASATGHLGGGLSNTEWDHAQTAGLERRKRNGAGAPKLRVVHNAPPIAPITLDEWLVRDLPALDCLVGDWLTTTSRVVLNAPTGIGKSMFTIGLGMSAGAGRGFLHWRARRPASVLYIDGEMSRRLLKERLAGEAQRLGDRPKGFYALSHEDMEFAPLNTRKGQEAIEQVIRQIGAVDLVLFDNIMSLIAGDMKDEESWRQTMPWIRSLTARRIGQVWIHHTGHDESRGYGTKTREWQMDTVIQLDPVEREDTDISFQLRFPKARERTPVNRADFADTKVALVGDMWSWQSTEGRRPDRVSPTAIKFLDALRNATIDSNAPRISGCPTASHDAWQTECVKLGLIDPKKKPDSARSMLSKYRLLLIAANLVACNETHAWTLT